MNVIGVGGAGCNVAKQFTKYPQYTVHYIDHKGYGKGSLKLKKYDHPEKYEEHAPDFTTFLEHLDGDDVILITCGASIVSSVMLRLLEKMQNKNVTVHYIKPDDAMLSKIKKLNEKVVRNVLQHFARSGKFDRVFLWDNQEVENVVGDVHPEIHAEFLQLESRIWKQMKKKCFFRLTTFASRVIFII